MTAGMTGPAGPLLLPEEQAGKAALKRRIFENASVRAATQPDQAESHKVVALADRAEEVITITELKPISEVFVGKQIARDGRIEKYPDIKQWWQSRTLVPATTRHLFAYLCSARETNVCIIAKLPSIHNCSRRCAGEPISTTHRPG